MDRFPSELITERGFLFQLDPSRLYIRISDPLDRGAFAELLLSAQLAPDDLSDSDVPFAPASTRALNQDDNHMWVRSVDRSPIDLVELQSVMRSSGVESMEAAPAFYPFDSLDASAIVAVLPNVIIVEPIPIPSGAADPLPEALLQHGLVEVEEASTLLHPHRYFVLNEGFDLTVFDIAPIIREEKAHLLRGVQFEFVPIMEPTHAIPNDPLFPTQWNLEKLSAALAWDIGTGDPSTVIAILDRGCDLNHPDISFSGRGRNLKPGGRDGSPTGHHGTAVAGIAAAKFNNNLGIAGVAPNCRIFPLATTNWSFWQLAMGIRLSLVQGARVINMSFGFSPPEWYTTLDGYPEFDAAFAEATGAGILISVSAGNYNRELQYPASHPGAIAVGASGWSDERQKPVNPIDENDWGSNYGVGLSVVAPGIGVPTTDRLGRDGYNKFDSAHGGDYTAFDGTSGAAPQVAGLLALLCSTYPFLSSTQIRNVLEQTTEKIGSVPYLDDPGYPNGSWNHEVGYGRVNAFRALDYADVMIRDWWRDSGSQPSTIPEGPIGASADILIKASDDGIFPARTSVNSGRIIRGQDNFVYIRVVNKGPNVARNVRVSARITPRRFAPFLYPHDWDRIDSTHLQPMPIEVAFSAIPRNGSVIARLGIPQAMVEEIWRRSNATIPSFNRWRPSLLARVESDNDYGFQSALSTLRNPETRLNNLARRDDLTVI